MAIFPGAQINARFYNEELSGKLNLLPATFGPARGQADQDEKYFHAPGEELRASRGVDLERLRQRDALGSARFYRALN